MNKNVTEKIRILLNFLGELFAKKSSGFIPGTPITGRKFLFSVDFLYREAHWSTRGTATCLCLAAPTPDRMVSRHINDQLVYQLLGKIKNRENVRTNTAIIHRISLNLK